MPAIRGCVASGKTLQEAYRTAIDAIESCLEDRSSSADRLFLTVYLRHLATKDDPAVQTELANANREISRGHKVGLRQMKQLHRTLARTCW